LGGEKGTKLRILLTGNGIRKTAPHPSILLLSPKPYAPSIKTG